MSSFEFKIVFSANQQKTATVKTVGRRSKRMSEKLNDVRGMSPQDVLEKYSEKSDVYAVDISEIMEKIGIYVIPFDFSEINQKLKCSVYGAIITDKENLGVFVSKKCSKAEKRFILAHELGHCCLHSHTLRKNKIECASDFDSDDEHEHAADVFADQILLPKKEFLEVCNSFIEKDVDTIAEIFCVPAKCVKRRMKALNIG